MTLQADILRFITAHIKKICIARANLRCYNELLAFEIELDLNLIKGNQKILT